MSVVVPAYNSETLIADALDSVFAQTHRPIELLVVDDGSTDNTVQAVADWQTAHADTADFTTQLIRQVNAGAPVARNRGIEAASGEYIQFLDADDVLYPDKLEKQLNHAIQLPENSASFCDWDVFDQQTSRQLGTCTHANWPSDEDSVVCLATGSLQTSSPLHPATNVDRVNGFDPALPCGQEFDLHLRMAASGIRFVHLPEILYQVRKSPGSIGSDKLKGTRQHEYIVGKVVQILQSNQTFTAPRKRALAKLFVADCLRFVAFKSWKEAWRRFRQAADLHPGGWPAVGGQLLRMKAGRIYVRLCARKE